VMFFRVMFPSAFLACFIGAISGGFVGEKLIG
jgi:hypothetical protein